MTKDKLSEITDPAIYIEELGISGDYMIDVPDGAIYLHNLMESFAESYSKEQVQKAWITEKPEFTEDCWLVTAGGGGCEIWQIKRVESDDGWYWGWLDSYGDEYGDINDMESEFYLILPEPPK